MPDRRGVSIKIIAVVLVIVVIVAVVAVWFISQPRRVESVKMGLLANLSGAFAEEGIRNEKLARYIVNKINAEGGIYVKAYGSKIPIELIVYDIESNPSRAVELATKMLTEIRPSFLLMSSAPPYSVPVFNIVEGQGGSIFFHADCAPADVYRAAMPKEAKWSWVEGSPISYAVMGYEALLKTFKDKTNGVAGILCIDDPDGHALNATITPILKNLGYKVVNPGLYPADLMDFSAYVIKFKQENVEVVWVNANPPHFADFWRKSNAMDFKPKIVLGGKYLIYECSTAEMIGGDLAVGLIAESQWNPEWPFPGNDLLKEAWANSGLDYTWGASHLASVVLFIKALVEEVGTLDVNALNSAIPKLEFESPVGKIKFDSETHISLQPMCFVQQVKVEGKWRLNVIWAPPGYGIPTKPMIFPIP